MIIWAGTAAVRMRADQLLTLSQWLSPAFPTGSFAWSHGLEQAVRDRAVADAAGLADWLSVQLAHGSGRNDAILCHAAARAAPADIADLTALALALCPFAERRAETLGQGRAFAAAVRTGWGHDLPDAPLPIVLGRAAALEGLPARPLVQVWLQATVTALVQAAQRLMPLGQTAAQQVIRGLSPLCLQTAEAAESQTLDDLGGAGLVIDIAAMRHEMLEPRIFRS
jgi:urease accessory protein